MTQINFKSQSYTVVANNDVLTTLLEAGEKIPFSCRTGSCQSCLMKATQGTPPKGAQVGLKDTLKAQSYFLACQCHPQENLEIDLPNTIDTRYKSRVLEKQWLNDDVIQIKLARPENFNFRAGQYLTLWKDKHLSRSYSIANLPDSNELEFHIRVLPQGQFSSWAAYETLENNFLEIQGPIGDCFYLEGAIDADLVLIGTGTGLAPLQGILSDALKAGHRGRIDLFHAGLNPHSLYNTDLLTKYASEYDNVFYHPCVLDKAGVVDSRVNYLEGNVSDIVFEKFPSMIGKKVYLCGDPNLVKKLKTKIFLSGANSQDIYADAFEPSQS
jgi:NAD(P)H-flavin reductase/ferredoxin